MKIAFAYTFVAGPYGGANQFLAALAREFSRRGVFEPNADQANVLLANANPGNLRLLARIIPAYKRARPSGKVLVRVDGPISLIRGRSQIVDRLIAALVHVGADGLIFQSNWSSEQNKRITNLAAPAEIVIHNAPDPAIFHPSQAPIAPAAKIRLIASSWSDNPRKGFDIYHYLDKHLNHSRYTMAFIGKTPIRFRTLRTLAPLSPRKLADELRQHDIYITASEHDPCSNSLIEALSCGLPAVVRRSGGHPELIQAGGITFDDTHDILPAIDTVAANLTAFRTHVPQFSIQAVADTYLAFANTVEPRPWTVATPWRLRALQIATMLRI